MSWLSGIFDFFKDLWDSITDILSDLWEELKVVLAVILIVCAIIFTAGAAGIALPGILSVFIVSSPYVAAGLCLAGAFLIDPDTTSEVLTDAVEGVGQVAEQIAEEVGTTFGTLVSSTASALNLKGLLLIGVVGFVGYKLLFDNEGDEDDAKALSSEVQLTA
jgi:hypothetical protein